MFLRKTHRWPTNTCKDAQYQWSPRKYKLTSQRGIASHLLECLLSKRQQITNIAEDVEKRGLLCTVGWGSNGCSCYGKQSGGSSKIESGTAIWSSNFSFGCFSEEVKALTVKDMCTLVLTLALFIIANMWTQPKCSLIDEWINKIWYKYTMDYYSALKTEILSYATTRRGLEGIMLKWNKSDKERQISCNFTYMWNLKNETS